MIADSVSKELVPLSTVGYCLPGTLTQCPKLLPVMLTSKSAEIVQDWVFSGLGRYVVGDRLWRKEYE